MLIDFRERGREGESKGKKHPCERGTLIGCLSYLPDLGMCPDIWESNPRPFGVWDDTQSTKPHWARARGKCFKTTIYLKF